MADGYTRGGKPDVGWWVGQINAGKEYRKEKASEGEWPKWRKWYRGEWNPGILPSNVYFKMMRTLIPRIYFRNPSVSLTPSKPGLENMLLCKLLERADNKLFDVTGLKGQMKRAVQNACMFGTGGLRLGYGAEFTPTPDVLEVGDPDVGTRRLRKRVEYNDLVHPNMPWVLSAHPGATIVPKGCSDIHSARWIAFETVRSPEDVKTDPRLSGTEDIGGAPGRPGLLSQSAANKDGVVLWEVRDKKSGCVFVIAPYAGSKDPRPHCLFFAEDDLQVNGHIPFYPVIFNNDDESFWGISDSQIIAPQQVEKNEIRTQLRGHRRVAIAKLLYESGAISPDELSKLVDGNSLAAVMVKNIGGVRELNMAGLAQVINILENTDAIIDQEVQQLLGLGVNQFGEYAPGSADRSATEANIVNSATMIRIDERRDACADVLVDVATDMNHVIIENWDSDIVMDVMGPAGVPIWIKVRPEALRDALYDVKVDPDTSLPRTKALREQKAVQAYGLFKTNPLINPMHLTQFVLSELYGVDADFLLLNPLMQTTPENPIGMPDAVNAMKQLPSAAMGDLQNRLASTGPAQVIPPAQLQE